MNYITVCPACETQFLLSTDQLKAHRGKVQCGHCQQLFNAKNRLTFVSDDISSTIASINPSNEVVKDSSGETSLAVYPNTDNSQAASHDFKETIPDTNDSVLPDDATFNGNENSEDNDEHNDDHVKLNQQLIKPTDAIVIEDLTTEPQFSKAPLQLKKLWLPLLGLLLIILALLQTVYFLRTQISAQYPQFKPYLLQACQLLHCKIKLAQNLALLTIDDSDMQESDDYQDMINFSSMLINNANYVQAYPNIELTLTDTQDQPVLRKLVTPEEYLSEDIPVETGMDAHQEVRLNLAINSSKLSVAGYRVLLVY